MRAAGLRRGLVALVALGPALGMAACGSSEPTARPLMPAPPRTAFSPAPRTAAPRPSPVAPTPSTVVPVPTSPSTSLTSPRPSHPPVVRAPLVVIDPGHSGRSIRSTDPATGLRDIDYPNYPEIYEMFDISSCVGAGLRADGYRVALTKRKALDSVGLAARARLANEGSAALAVSVHDDHLQGPGFQATYSQRGIRHGGSYHAMYRGTGSGRVVFRDAHVARASEIAAATIAGERTRAQGRTVGIRENTFTGRPPLEPGNLAIVQLLAKVPWVYNEAGARVGGSTTRAMSIAAEQAYAKGLLLGVEAAVPLASGRVPQPSAGAKQLHGCLVTAAKQGRPGQYRPVGS